LLSQRRLRRKWNAHKELFLKRGEEREKAMPIIKKVIQETEYSFAPLRVKQIRAIRAMKKTDDAVELLDAWVPMIQDSMQRAGSQMPDLEEMDLETGNGLLAEMIGAVMEASGSRLAAPATEAK
jgi:hypothetical protein